MEALFELLEGGAGLDVVVWVQRHSNRPLDALAIALSVMGGFPIYLLLFMPLYWAVDKRLAKRFLFALIISGLAVAAFKLSLGRPRPFIAYPEQVQVLIVESTFGFPSGHVGITLPVLGVLVAVARRWWAWVGLFAFVAVMGWARMYVGVHYPQDLAGGLVIGLAALFITLALYDRLAAWWGTVAVAARGVALLVISGLIAYFMWQDIFDVIVAGVIVGAGNGFMLEQRRLRFDTGGPGRRRTVRLLVGLILTGLLLGALLWGVVALDLPLGFEVAVYAVVGFFVAWVYPWLAVRWGLMHTLPELRQSTVEKLIQKEEGEIHANG